MKLTDLNKYIIPAIAVAVVIYLIWKKGKKSGLTFVPEMPYLDAETQKAVQGAFNPNPLAEELYNAMDGIFTLTGTKDKVWRKLYELPTDNMIIMVYNTFNLKYASKGKGSLTKWINDETYYDYLTGVKTKVLTKLRSLNCK